MDKEREALVEGLKSLKVLLGTDSPEVRGWAPAVQQEAQKLVNATIAALTAQQPQEPSGVREAVEAAALLEGVSPELFVSVLRGEYATRAAEQVDADDGVVVPREQLTLWRRVMLQNPGDYEDKCADEMSALLAAAKEPRQAAGMQHHPDDDAVDLFAAAMKAKLAVKRAQGRGGWDDPDQCSISDLERMLDEHYAREGQHIDCANFLMMIWHRKIAAAKESR